MRVFSLSSVILAAIVSFTKATSIELTPNNIDTLTASGTWLIEHFSPSCGHCTKFAPEWKRLTDDLTSLETESDFHFGTIDCMVRGDLCVQHGIRGYPSIQLWKNGAKVETYDGANEYDPLTEYIYKFIKNSQSTVEQASLEKEEGEEKDLEQEEEEEEESNEALEEEEEEEQSGLEVAETQQQEEPEFVVDAILPNAEGISVDLDDAKLKEIAAGTTPWFIKFYAPWCGHCQALAPTWVELGAQLRNQINVGEVNCDVLRSTCTEFNIGGFPTLRLYGRGEAITYSGSRSLSSMMDFAKANSGPAVKDVTAKELTTYLAAKDVSLIYVYKDKGSIPELIESVASTYTSTIPFYTSHDEATFEKFNLAQSDLPTVLITKDNGYRVYTGAHDFSKNTKSARDALVDWIEKEQYPLISKLGPSNYKSILEGSHPVVLNIVSLTDAKSQSKFREAASSWLQSVKNSDVAAIFAEMDRSMWKDYVLQKFNIPYSENAKVIIYDAPNYKFYATDLDQHEFSLDKPQEIHLALKSIDKLKGGKSTLAVHQRLIVSIGNGFNWVLRHWVISIFGFGIIGSLLFRYLTFHGPKGRRIGGGNGVLPLFRPVDTHKD